MGELTEIAARLDAFAAILPTDALAQRMRDNLERLRELDRTLQEPELEFKPGDRVKYTGPTKCLQDKHGTVKGPSTPGHVRVLWDTDYEAEPVRLVEEPQGPDVLTEAEAQLDVAIDKLKTFLASLRLDA